MIITDQQWGLLLDEVAAGIRRWRTRAHEHDTQDEFEYRLLKQPNGDALLVTEHRDDPDPKFCHTERRAVVRLATGELKGVRLVVKKGVVTAYRVKPDPKASGRDREEAQAARLHHDPRFSHDGKNLGDGNHGRLYQHPARWWRLAREGRERTVDWRNLRDAGGGRGLSCQDRRIAEVFRPVARCTGRRPIAASGLRRSLAMHSDVTPTVTPGQHIGWGPSLADRR
jgi:hypothetical protein